MFSNDEEKEKKQIIKEIYKSVDDLHMCTYVYIRDSVTETLVYE